MMVVDSVKEITQYQVFFYPDEHPDIFEAPRYRRKSMCMEILESKFDLVDPIVRGEWISANKIELLIYSYEKEEVDLEWPEEKRSDTRRKE